MYCVGTLNWGLRTNVLIGIVISKLHQRKQSGNKDCMQNHVRCYNTIWMGWDTNSDRNCSFNSVPPIFAESLFSVINTQRIQMDERSSIPSNVSSSEPIATLLVDSSWIHTELFSVWVHTLGLILNPRCFSSSYILIPYLIPGPGFTFRSYSMFSYHSIEVKNPSKYNTMMKGETLNRSVAGRL